MKRLQGMEEAAPAKINLSLRVLRRRDDGFHEIETRMAPISLYDSLQVEPADAFEFRADDPTLPMGEDNLVVRAAQAFFAATATDGVSVHLRKMIPHGAGLGGGSSDAASTLLALDRLFETNLTREALAKLAEPLGSDVPFFLFGGLALCEGRGERVTALSSHWPGTMRWLLLLKPAISVSTAAVFRNLPASDYTDGMYSRAVCTALHAGQTPELEDLHNCFERSVLETYPEVALSREVLLCSGASFVRLSGTGPTLFAPFSDLTMAQKVQKQLQTQGYEVYLSRAIHPNDGIVSVF